MTISYNSTPSTEFGLKGLSGKPLKKGWKIATDVPQLNVLVSHAMVGTHMNSPEANL